jgi:hypothetical protein
MNREDMMDSGRGGAVKADVGLANVDNTADSAKPVSTAQRWGRLSNCERACSKAENPGAALHSCGKRTHSRDGMFANEE